MISKQKLLKTILKLQTSFEAQDKEQIKKLVCVSPNQFHWNSFNQIQQNIESLYLLNINNFRSLKSLVWDSGDNSEQEQIPKSIVLDLNNLNNLCEINLRFNSSTIFSDQFFHNLLVENLSQISTLNKFGIMLYQCHISQKNQLDLASNITLLQNLQHLIVSFNSGEREDEHFLSKLWLAISSLNILESLSLDFNGVYQNLDEVNLESVFKDKPICETLKVLRMNMIGVYEDASKAKYAPLNLFKNLEMLIYEQDLYTSYQYQEIDDLFVEILKNNKKSLKKLDLTFFEMTDQSFVQSDSSLDEENIIPLKFLDQIKNLNNLQRLKLVSNKFTKLGQIKTLIENAKQCIFLSQFYFLFDFCFFVEHDQKEFKQIYRDLMSFPYLTQGFAGDQRDDFLGRYFKDIILEAFDVESRISHYLDSFTISRLYKKYEKQIESNDISLEKLISIFNYNFSNNRIQEQDFILPELPQNNKDELSDEADNSSYLLSSEISYSQSSNNDEYYQLIIYGKLLNIFLNQKNSEIVKISIFKDKICQTLKEALGDLSLIKYLYWDLHI